MPRPYNIAQETSRLIASSKSTGITTKSCPQQIVSTAQQTSTMLSCSSNSASALQKRFHQPVRFLPERHHVHRFSVPSPRPLHSLSHNTSEPLPHFVLVSARCRGLHHRRLASRAREHRQVIQTCSTGIQHHPPNVPFFKKLNYVPDSCLVESFVCRLTFLFNDNPCHSHRLSSSERKRVAAPATPDTTAAPSLQDAPPSGPTSRH